MKSPLLIVCLTLIAGCSGLDAQTENSGGVVEIPRIEDILLDGSIGAGEWASAWRTDSAFVIENAEKLSGTFPFEFLVGGNEKALFLGIRISGLAPNEVGDASNTRLGDVIRFYITGPDGPLDAPSDGIACSYIWKEGSSCLELYWDGTQWENQPETDGVSEFNAGRPTDGRWGTGGVEGEHTIVWEQVIHRTSALPEYDGFQADGPTEFRLAVGFARAPDQTSVVLPSDVYPGGISTDPTAWLRMRIT